MMSKKRPDPRVVVHGGQVSAVQVGKSVWRVRIAEECHLGRGGNIDDRLEEGASSFLNKLPKRVKIGGELRRRWEDPFAVLALALTEELFPPFADIVEAWLETRQQFDLLATRVQKASRNSILKSIIGRCR